MDSDDELDSEEEIPANKEAPQEPQRIDDFTDDDRDQRLIFV